MHVNFTQITQEEELKLLTGSVAILLPFLYLLYAYYCTKGYRRKERRRKKISIIMSMKKMLVKFHCMHTVFNTFL